MPRGCSPHDAENHLAEILVNLLSNARDIPGTWAIALRSRFSADYADCEIATTARESTEFLSQIAPASPPSAKGPV